MTEELDKVLEIQLKHELNSMQPPWLLIVWTCILMPFIAIMIFFFSFSAAIIFEDAVIFIVSMLVLILIIIIQFLSTHKKILVDKRQAFMQGTIVIANYMQTKIDEDEK